MTRIVHVSDHYLPRLGGIETLVHDLSTHQRAAGHEVHVVAATARPEGGAPDPAYLHRVDRRRPLTWPGEIEGLLRGGDLDDTVVHVHVSVWSPLSTLLARRAVTLGVPTVATVHSLWSHLGPAPETGRVLLNLRRWPMQWSGVSDRAAAPLRRMLGPGFEVDVLPNAVEPADWALEHRPSAVPTIVSVMRFARTKRPLPLMRMLRDLREQLPASTPLRAVLVGDGPHREHAIEYAARHAMRDWVELPGRLTRPQVREELARSWVYVAPAWLESFGIAALEARVVGLPVVASSRSGVEEFVTDGVNGFLAPDDGAIVEAMRRLVTDEALRTRMTAYNRATPTTHDWPAALAACERTYARAHALAARPVLPAGR